MPDDADKPDLRTAIIIPVVNESGNLRPLFDYLARHQGRHIQVFVDGGSKDNTVYECRKAGFEVVSAPAGRARQMNAGVQYVKDAHPDILWFLHADCLPPADAIEWIQAHATGQYDWGRFDVSLTGRALIYRLIETLMNWRSCLTRVCTGDQGIFVGAQLFEEVGGFDDIPLMEDIAITKKLRRQRRPICLVARMKISSRRWECRGVVRTMLLMWWLRWRYFSGADPVDLHRQYYGS